MSKQADYSYIQWLPENRMVIATTEALLQEKYITGLFGNNIFPYSRDDNATFSLPALSVDTGEVFSYDNYDRLEGEISIFAYFGINLIREQTTKVIQSTSAIIRSRIQNNDFAENVALNMFEYNKTLSSYKDNFDKEYFKKAMLTKHPLQRYGISFKSKPATSASLNMDGKTDCYKSTMTFKYWIMQQDYYNMLELMGVNAAGDPNKIVYKIWEEFDINIQEQ